jgi:hypothetical protein
MQASSVARITDHQTLFGVPTHCPPAIGYLITDHRERLNQGPWLARAGIRDRVRLYAIRDDPRFNWKRLRDIDARIHVFEECLTKLDLPPGSLLIVDTIALFITSKLNDYHSVAVGLGEIDQVLQRGDLTLWSPVHMGKQPDDPKKTYKRKIDRILGSGAQVGFADTAMALLGPDDTGEPCYTLSVSPSLECEFDFRYERTESGLFVPFQGLAEVGNTPETDRPTQISLLIPEPDGIRVGDLLEKACETFGISRRQFFNDWKTLRSRGLVEQDQCGAWHRRKPS